MSLSNTSTTDFTVQLRDGRKMGIAAVGPGGDFPILHCHGSGSSRLEVRLLAAATTEVGVRLIGLDRPGIGRSDPKVGYRLLDWPDDVEAVADQLGIERFAIEGVSAGGPYALACAYKIPQRLTTCGLISTVSPPDLIRKAGPWAMRTMWRLGAQFPWFVRSYASLVTRIMGSDKASLEKYLTRYAAQMGTADQKVLSNPEARDLLAQIMAESARQGRKANIEEALTGTRFWGFRPEQIAFEKLYVWHGEQDRLMPIAPVRLFVQALPYCTAVFYPDEGHFSVVANHAREILHTLSV